MSSLDQCKTKRNGSYSGGVESKICESAEGEGAGDGWTLPRQGGATPRAALPVEPKRRSVVELRAQSRGFKEKQQTTDCW